MVTHKMEEKLIELVASPLDSRRERGRSENGLKPPKIIVKLYFTRSFATDKENLTTLYLRIWKKSMECNKIFLISNKQ